MRIEISSFGKLSNGKEIKKIDLYNDHNISVSIINYGAIIQSLNTPDEKGEIKDIVLGYDNIEGYENDPYYMGAVIGPVAGRISNAQFLLNSKTIELEKNQDIHHLHGGSQGLHQKVWEVSTEKRHNSIKVVLKTSAKDGENGYPGNRLFKTTYILNNKNQLLIYFDVETDTDTVIGLTSHSYFNLSDKESDTIYEHLMMINAQKTVVMDEHLIPTGAFNFVLGKAENFSRGKKLGDAIQQIPQGIDHAYVVNKELGIFGISAKAVHTKSGRTIDLVTNQPAVILYTTNFPDGSVSGKNNLPIITHGAFCLEPMHLPDAVNQQTFPSIVLKAGEKYKSRNQFTFGLVSHSHHH